MKCINKNTTPQVLLKHSITDRKQGTKTRNTIREGSKGQHGGQDRRSGRNSHNFDRNLQEKQDIDCRTDVNLNSGLHRDSKLDFVSRT